MTTVLLARHGETTWNRECRLQGWAPTGLTDRGRAQADRLGAHLADAHDVARIVASDLARVEETVAELRTHLDAPVTADEAWRERGLGVYEGEAYEVLFEDPETSVRAGGADAIEGAPEGGESVREIRERVVAAFEDLAAEMADGETVLVVAHGGPLKHVVGHLAGRDPVASVCEATQHNCALTELDLAGESPRVVRENWTGYRDA